MSRARSKLSRRTGFSMIEVLVVISLIIILIALLLPAVQSVREASRRSQCQYNLRQLGVALSAYTMNYGCLPPGIVDDPIPKPQGSPGYRMSWVAQVLPYMDRHLLFDGVNFDHGSLAAANQTVRMAPIDWAICPTSSSITTPSFQSFGGGVDVDLDDFDSDPVYRKIDGAFPAGPQNHYAGCHHHLAQAIAEDNTGVLTLNSAIRPRDIPDGLSYTLFVGEKTSDSTPLGWLVGGYNTLRNTGEGFAGGAPTQQFGQVAPGQVFDDLGNRITHPGTFFSGPHPGGGNLLFGDGAVAFRIATVSPAMFQLIGHRYDGVPFDRL